VEQEIISRNSLLQTGEKYYYADCTGIKTGHHNKAGWCFVGSAERDGMRVICVVLKCEEEMSKWYDAARLFEYGFTRYERVTKGALIDAAWKQRYSQIRVENADPDDSGSLVLNLSLEDGDDETLPVVAGSRSSLNAAADRLVTVEWARDFVAPIEADEVMGTLTCAVDGVEVKGTLTAARTVAARPEPTPTNEPMPTEIAAAPQVDEPPPPTAGRRGSGLVVFVILAAVLSASGIAVVASLKKAQRRRARARRRRVAQRGRAQGRPKASQAQRRRSAER
jgi:D-alanyl-D-alanine carboxypeptidase